MKVISKMTEASHNSLSTQRRYAPWSAEDFSRK